MSALGPLPLGLRNFIVTVSSNMLLRPGWSIKIIHKYVVIFKKINIHYQQKNCVLFLQGIFSTKSFVNSSIETVASTNTTNIKVCVLRGLSRDCIKVWNWGIRHANAIETLTITWWYMVINVISSNLEAKFIKRYWVELRIKAGFFSYHSGKLEFLREWKPGFFNFAVSFNYVKSFRHILQTFSDYWLLSTYIFRRLSTHLDSIFQKRLVYIFVSLEIGNLHWKILTLLWCISSCEMPV